MLCENINIFKNFKKYKMACNILNAMTTIEMSKILSCEELQDVYIIFEKCTNIVFFSTHMMFYIPYTEHHNLNKFRIFEDQIEEIKDQRLRSSLVLNSCDLDNGYNLLLNLENINHEYMNSLICDKKEYNIGVSMKKIISDKNVLKIVYKLREIEELNSCMITEDKCDTIENYDCNDDNIPSPTNDDVNEITTEMLETLNKKLSVLYKIRSKLSTTNITLKTLNLCKMKLHKMFKQF